MKKTAIIGDIHGCRKTLLALLEKLPADTEEIYAVGDLIDRGPDSFGVIQTCIDRGIKPVRGNHEDMFIDFINGCPVYGASDMFLNNGGDATIKSYRDHSPEGTLEMPLEHATFLEGLPYFIETEDFFLSHAGVSSYYKKLGMDWRDMESEVTVNMLKWNRENIATLDKLQVYGHTPVTDVHKVNRNGSTVAINVDTGSVFGYRLSAILVPSLEVIQVRDIDMDQTNRINNEYSGYIKI